MNIYEYKIIITSAENEGEKTGKATLEELAEIIPLDIYNQIRNNDTLELKLVIGDEIYFIKKVI